MFDLAPTPILLSMIFAGLLAIVFDWFPPVANWYNPLSALKKKQIMGVALAIIAGLIFAGGCYGLFNTSLTCDKTGIATLVTSCIAALATNQQIHDFFKPINDNGTRKVI